MSWAALRLPLALAIALAIPLGSGPAFAEEPPDKLTQALALMRENKFEEARPLLEAAIQENADIIIEFRLAECLEQIGLVASAWRRYQGVVERAQNPEQKKFAQSRVDALAARLTWLELQVTPAAQAIAGMVIELDGKPLEPAAWVEAVALDPGEHKVRAQAPGRVPWEHRVTAKGDVVTRILVDVPALEALPPDVLPIPAPTKPEPAPPPEEGPPTMLIAGIAVGSLGVIGMVAGIGLGAAAKSAYDDSLANCTGGFCNEAGLAEQDDAVLLGDVGTAVFIVGAVATAAGITVVVLDLVTNEPSEIALVVTPTGPRITGHW